MLYPPVTVSQADAEAHERAMRQRGRALVERTQIDEHSWRYLWQDAADAPDPIAPAAAAVDTEHPATPEPTALSAPVRPAASPVPTAAEEPANPFAGWVAAAAGADGADDPVKQMLDAALETTTDNVPDGSPAKQVLSEAAWWGIPLGVLIGNVPISWAVAKLASRKGALDVDTLTTYFDVFKLVTPWVAVFGLAAYLTRTDQWPKMSLAAYAFALAGVVLLAGYVSLKLGGPVPATVMNGPSEGGPSAATKYAGESLGSYVKLYGPLPPLAGLLEGLLFGRWAALGHNDP